MVQASRKERGLGGVTRAEDLLINIEVDVDLPAVVAMKAVSDIGRYD